jgi:DNA repair exonuclease SbcCD ATPase subunit
MTEEELKKEVERLALEKQALENSKKRVEEENAKYKKRAQEVEEKLSEAEKKKLEEQGNLQELLRKEREEKDKLIEKYTGLKAGTLKEKLKAEVAKIAKDAHNVEDILRVTEAKSLLKLDEDNLLIDGVEDFVTKVRELRPHFFSKTSVKAGEDNPPNKESGKGETVDQAYFRELKACKTQKDFDNVRKKYGKLN